MHPNTKKFDRPSRKSKYIFFAEFLNDLEQFDRLDLKQEHIKIRQM